MNTHSQLRRCMWLGFVILFSQSVSAQSIYQKDDNVIGLGIGLGGAYEDVSYASYQTPIFNVNYERAIWPLGGENIKGIISMGGLVGYKRFGYTTPLGYNNYTYGYDWSYTMLAVRSAWHLQSFKGKDLKKWDLYWGLMLGINRIRQTYRDNDPNFNYGLSQNSTRSTFGGYFGARYFFNESWAVSAETGFGYSSLNFGAAYKF
jgi:hypothetical protein